MKVKFKIHTIEKLGDVIGWASNSFTGTIAIVKVGRTLHEVEINKLEIIE